MRGTSKRWLRLVALFAVVAIFAAACGDDDDGGSDTETDGDTTEETTDEGDTSASTEADGEAMAGGEFIDAGTFVGDPPEHIDPALNTTLDAYQVIRLLYNGLTDVDFSDTDTGPVVKPHVAESYEANEDATVWTFTIRDDVFFSNGEQVLPSSFQNAWERASDPDFAGDYSYLFTFIEGGAEKLDGTADTISGVEADDEAMTLTVTLAEPYSNFDAVAGFMLFYPMPTEAIDAADPNEWENGIMIGNGAYLMEAPRNDEEIVLVRNDDWAGDANGETWDDRLERIVFQTTADPDTSLNSMLAGEAMTANIPPGRVNEVREVGNTLDTEILGTYYFQFNDANEIIGGDDNVLLRQAISQAINRDEINDAVYEGTRPPSSGITPLGIPGAIPDICEYCVYDVEAAQAAFDEWTAAGNSLSEPVPIQFNADAGHEPVVQIMVDNLGAVGIDAVATPMDSETYFSDLADGACIFCRSGWFADYPTYDNFMFDLFYSTSGNNFGYSNEEFDALVDEGKSTVDKDAANEAFQNAERILLNEDIGAVPINYYLGEYAYDDEAVASFPYTSQGIVLYEQIELAG